MLPVKKTLLRQWLDKSDFIETLDQWPELTMSGTKVKSFPYPRPSLWAILSALKPASSRFGGKPWTWG